MNQTLMASLLTLLTYIYGLISTPIFWAIIFLASIDFVLGVYAAYKNGELDWDVCLHGIANKVFIGILILVSAIIDFALMYFGINTGGIFHKFIMAALLTRELGSNIKNAEKCGFWVPKLLKEANKKLADFGKEKGSEFNNGKDSN
jgi:toxin secretion/phage lysis holin